MADVIGFAKVFAYLSLAIVLLVIAAANLVKKKHIRSLIRWLKKNLCIDRFCTNRPKKDLAARQKKYQKGNLKKYYFVETELDQVDAAKDCVLTGSKAIGDESHKNSKLIFSTSLDEKNNYDRGVNVDVELGEDTKLLSHEDTQTNGQTTESNANSENKTEVSDDGSPEAIALAKQESINDLRVEIEEKIVKEDVKLSHAPVRHISETSSRTKEPLKRGTSFVSNATTKEIVESDGVFQIYVGERAVYLYSYKEKFLGCELLCQFKADAVIRFYHPSDYTLLQYPPHPGLYDMTTTAYSVDDRTVDKSCLFESGIITIEQNGTGQILEMESFTVPQWGFYQDPDYYSMLLLDERLKNMALKRPLEKLKIIIYSNESLYVSTIAMLESLEYLEDSTKPVEVIHKIKEIHNLRINEKDQNFVLDKLMHCRKQAIERVSLQSFVTSHPVSSLDTEFCRTVVERLREIVPDMDLSMCVSAVQYQNRTLNRRCTILPMDSERPFLGGPSVSPLECDYINASFIKGPLSAYQFVVTEWPQQQTIPLFWRLIHRYDISTIIVIGSQRPLKLSGYPFFWPTGRARNKIKKYGRYVVKRTSKSFGGLDMVGKNSLQIVEHRLGEVLEHNCKLHYIPQWPGFLRPVDDVFINSVFQLVLKEWQQQQDMDEGTRLCVVSTDGAGKCGVILGVWSILDQLLISEPRVFDYINTMRLIKLNRPMMLSSPDEIEILYKIIHKIYQERHELDASRMFSSKSKASLSSYKCALSSPDFTATS